MTTATTKVVEANDWTTDHALEIFRAWKKCLPDLRWAHAEIDRQEGLTLTTDDGRTALHFAQLKCGYQGTGAAAAARLLEEASFGDLNQLRNTLFIEQRYTFELA